MNLWIVYILCFIFLLLLYFILLRLLLLLFLALRLMRFLFHLLSFPFLLILFILLFFILLSSYSSTSFFFSCCYSFRLLPILHSLSFCSIFFFTLTTTTLRQTCLLAFSASYYSLSYPYSSCSSKL